MVGEDPHTATPDVDGIVATMERLQQDWLRAFAAYAGPAATADDSANALPGEMSRLSAPLLRAQAAWLEGGLRYMGRLAETNAACVAEVSRRLSDLPAEGLDERGRRELNDELRAYLRRLADISSQEARVLESRLAEVEAGLRETAAEPPAGAAVRRARVKD